MAQDARQQGQEFVIGWYTPRLTNFDALIFGYYEGDKLLYTARKRNGFTPGLCLFLKPTELTFKSISE